MAERKKWRMNLVPGGHRQSFRSQVKVYEAVQEQRFLAELGMVRAIECHVFCNDELYEIVRLPGVNTKETDG